MRRSDVVAACGAALFLGYLWVRARPATPSFVVDRPQAAVDATVRRSSGDLASPEDPIQQLEQLGREVGQTLREEATVVCKLGEPVSALDEVEVLDPLGDRIAAKAVDSELIFIGPVAWTKGTLVIRGYAPVMISWTRGEVGAPGGCLPNPIPLLNPELIVAGRVSGAFPERGMILVDGCGGRTRARLAAQSFVLEATPGECEVQAFILDDRLQIAARSAPVPLTLPNTGEVNVDLVVHPVDEAALEQALLHLDVEVWGDLVENTVSLDGVPITIEELRRMVNEETGLEASSIKVQAGTLGMKEGVMQVGPPKVWVHPDREFYPQSAGP